MSQGLLLLQFRLFLRRLLFLPLIQQGHDLVFHLPGRDLLAKILAQFCGGKNHFIYLLFFLAQNAVNGVRVQLTLLVQFPQFLRLGERVRTVPLRWKPQ